MLSLLFSCPGCATGAASRSFPLCERCLGSLLPSPPLCPACGGFCPHSGCVRPWIRETSISAFHSRYLLVGRSYEVCRAWKRGGGPLLDRRVLGPISAPEGRFDAIVPIPHSSRRAFQLGRSPSERVASRMADLLDVPVVRALSARPEPVRMARLSAVDRLTLRAAFTIRPEARARVRGTILLVDDFMTTGRTLRSAAALLRQAGAERVEAYVLGLRPARTHRLAG